eukprot:m.348908 g.348908  ORF g.348908 m.348908 type:complete len:77 (-) comp16563_c2_seq13:47-277(-)
MVGDDGESMDGEREDHLQRASNTVYQVINAGSSRIDWSTWLTLAVMVHQILRCDVAIPEDIRFRLPQVIELEFQTG